MAASAAWSWLDWQRYLLLLLPLLDFRDIGRLACVSRDMRKLAHQSACTQSFVHHQRGARLYAELDLAFVLRHARMPPSFVEEVLRSRALYNCIATVGKDCAVAHRTGPLDDAFRRGIAPDPVHHGVRFVRGYLCAPVLSDRLNACALSPNLLTHRNLLIAVSACAFKERNRYSPLSSSQ